MGKLLFVHRTMIKVFIYERKGFSIFYKRLDESSFQFRDIVGKQVNYKMSAEQIMYILNGMSLESGS